VDHLLKGPHSHKMQFIEFFFDQVLVDESRFHVVKSFINGLLCDSTRRSGVVSRNQSLSIVRRVIVVAAKDGHHKIVDMILQGYWILASCIGQNEIRSIFGDRHEMNGQGLLGSDKDGWTPVHWATAHGNERVLQVIFDFAMKKGINTTSLLSPDKKYGETPMHRAALLGQCEIMKFIVNNLQNKCIDPRLGRKFKETKRWRWRLLRWSVLYHPTVVKESKPSNELNVISLLGPDLNKETTVHRAASQVGQVKCVILEYDDHRR
jgi:Ankyrin repeats (3 copies)